jgi:hypothetical protein
VVLLSVSINLSSPENSPSGSCVKRTEHKLMSMDLVPWKHGRSTVIPSEKKLVKISSSGESLAAVRKRETRRAAMKKL